MLFQKTTTTLIIRHCYVTFWTNLHSKSTSNLIYILSEFTLFSKLLRLKMSENMVSERKNTVHLCKMSWFEGIRYSDISLHIYIHTGFDISACHAVAIYFCHFCYAYINLSNNLQETFENPDICCKK